MGDSSAMFRAICSQVPTQHFTLVDRSGMAPEMALLQQGDAEGPLR